MKLTNSKNKEKLLKCFLSSTNEVSTGQKHFNNFSLFLLFVNFTNYPVFNKWLRKIYRNKSKKMIKFPFFTYNTDVKLIISKLMTNSGKWLLLTLSYLFSWKIVFAPLIMSGRFRDFERKHDSCRGQTLFMFNLLWGLFNIEIY